MSRKQTSDRRSDARSTSAAQLSITGSAATEAFQRIARQNQAFIGDVIDWTLASMRIPTRESDAKSVLEAQAAEARDFAGKARRRMQEYVDIASGLGQQIAESPAGSEQARHVVAATTERAHEAIETAGGTPDPMARAAGAAAKGVSEAVRAATAGNESASDRNEAASETKDEAASDTGKAASTTARPSKKKAVAKRKAAGKKSASKATGKKRAS